MERNAHGVRCNYTRSLSSAILLRAGLAPRNFRERCAERRATVFGIMVRAKEQSPNTHMGVRIYVNMYK